MNAPDEIDWTAFYQWKSRQTSQLSLREEAEMLSMFDNTTDPESLEMDLAFARIGKGRKMRTLKYSPSICYALFFGRMRPAIMDDFGNPIVCNFQRI
jgi:hypothetical protein